MEDVTLTELVVRVRPDNLLQENIYVSYTNYIGPVPQIGDIVLVNRILRDHPYREFECEVMKRHYSLGNPFTWQIDVRLLEVPRDIEPKAPRHAR